MTRDPKEVGAFPDELPPPADARETSGADAGELVDLAGRLLEHLWSNGLRLAVAESCTGGLLGGRITDVPGASQAFVGGIIAYGDEAKMEVLGVDVATLRRAGAVSAATVEAMARGVRKAFAADVAIAVSGVAGPSGGTTAKPVGTVWVAVLGPEHLLNVHKLSLAGDRDAIRKAAVDEALRLAFENVREGEREGVA